MCKCGGAGSIIRPAHDIIIEKFVDGVVVKSVIHMERMIDACPDCTKAAEYEFKTENG